MINATISPTSLNYDLASPSDVSTTITWGGTAEVTGVVYGATPLTISTDYTVSGNILTIMGSYLAAQGLTAGDTAVFTISFDKGNSATLTVSIVNNHIPSNNADLSKLIVGGSMVNSFAPDTTSYNVELPHGTQPGNAAATVSAEVVDPKAGVNITQASTLPGSATVEVTAEDGTTKKTYTISFTLKAAPPVQSSEKDVTSVITPGGASISSTSITVTVVNSVTNQAVNLSVSTGASWKLYSDASYNNEITSKTMMLSDGTNMVYVRVTAEDGSTKDYTLTIIREGSEQFIPVTEIRIIGGNTINTKNGTLQLAADVVPENATNKAVVWSIASGSSFATLNATGLLTAQSNGTVTVHATAQDGSNVYGELQIAISEQGGSSGTVGGGTVVGYTPATDITTDKQPSMPTTARMRVSGTMKDGIPSATITEQMVRDAIKAVQDAAEKSGNNDDGIALYFSITGSGSYTGLYATIEAGAIDRLKEAGVRFITIGSAVLDITFDIGAIAEIDRQSTDNVTVSARPQTKLSEAAKELIGSRPVFDITVGYQKNGETKYITNFGQGAVTLGIAYNATAKESASNLFGVYVDRNGRPQLLNNSSYNNGRLIFNRNSLSTYGVGYKASAPVFTDTAKHWAKDNIDFVTGLNLISGTSKTTFSPNTAIIRADFLMALGKLSGVDVSSYKTSSFTDVRNNDPAMPYIEWAVKNKIVSGYGNGKFGPNDSITREQIALMMGNYAKATGYKMPATRQAIAFADEAKISPWAREAVKAIQQTGVIVGKTGNLFDPQGNATRAEASTILHRFVEFVIEKGTARGWSQNDVNQWLYIGENGKAVIGWLTEGNTKYYFTSDGIMVSGKWHQIDGNWYYFYADGSLAKSTKVDGYEVDENGARKMK